MRRQEYVRRGSRRSLEKPRYEDPSERTPDYEEPDYEDPDYEDPYDEEPYEEEHRERSEKKAGKKRSALPLVLFLILLLTAVTGFGVWFFSIQRPERKLPGTWRMEIDLTQSVCAEADRWLAAAEGGERFGVEERLGKVSVGVILTMNPDGTWTQTVDPASCEAAGEAAYTALSETFRELLLFRVEAAGREAGSAEEAEALIVNTIGMSTEEYLKGYGPALVPTEEELLSRFEGSGSYEAKGNMLWQNGSGSEYLVSDEMLVITGSEETFVYHREGAR